MIFRGDPDQPNGPRAGSPDIRHRAHRLLFRRIWLPSLLYQALPLLYLLTGMACLAGGLYLPDQAWLLPYLGLLGLGCIHAGYLAASARRRYRLGRRLRSRSAAGSRTHPPATAQPSRARPLPVQPGLMPKSARH